LEVEGWASPLTSCRCQQCEDKNSRRRF
jgi:hypothetical protein